MPIPIDDMPAGPDMDIRIQKEVLGLCVHDYRGINEERTGKNGKPWTFIGKRCIRCGDEFLVLHYRDDLPDGWGVPPYSTDLREAWKVDRPGWLWLFDEMDGDTLAVDLWPSHRDESGNWAIVDHVCVTVPMDENNKLPAYALVRCRAAVKAVKVTEVDECIPNL